MMILPFLTAFAHARVAKIPAIKRVGASATDELTASFIQYNLAGEKAGNIVKSDLKTLVGKLDKDIYVITSQETGHDAWNTYLLNPTSHKSICSTECPKAVEVYNSIEAGFKTLSKGNYVKLAQQLNGYIGVIIFVKKSLQGQFTDAKGYTYDNYAKLGKGNSKGSASITADFKAKQSGEVFPLHFTSLHLPAHEGAEKLEKRRKYLARIIEKSLAESQDNCKKKKNHEKQQCLDNTTMVFNGDFNWRVEVPSTMQKNFYGNKKQGWNPADSKGDKKATKCIEKANEAAWLKDMREFDEGEMGFKNIKPEGVKGKEYELVEALTEEDKKKGGLALSLNPSFKPADPKTKGATSQTKCYTMYRQPSFTDRVTFLQQVKGSTVHFTATDYGTSIGESNNLYQSDHFPVVANVKLHLGKNQSTAPRKLLEKLVHKPVSARKGDAMIKIGGGAAVESKSCGGRASL